MPCRSGRDGADADAAIVGFGRYEGPVPQRKTIVLRKRYWLYYAMTFMSGARRQLFHAFAGFLLVKKFGFTLTQTALLMLVTSALTAVLGRTPWRARSTHWGERRTIQFENIVLIFVFAGYALTPTPWSRPPCLSLMACSSP